MKHSILSIVGLALISFASFHSSQASDKPLCPELQKKHDVILNTKLRDDTHRLAVIRSTATHGNSELIPALLSVASNYSGAESRSVRYMAMIALGELKAQEATPLFRSIIKAAHTMPQSSWGLDTYVGYAFEALGNIGSPEAKELLVNSIFELNQMDLDIIQRCTLISALAKVQANAEDVLEEITSLLNSKSSEFRLKQAAIHYLDKIGTEQSIKALTTFAENTANGNVLIQDAKSAALSACQRLLKI